MDVYPIPRVNFPAGIFIYDSGIQGHTYLALHGIHNLLGNKALHLEFQDFLCWVLNVLEALPLWLIKSIINYQN